MREWLNALFGTMSRRPNADCSFCGRSYADVGPLVEAPNGSFICDGCVTRDDERGPFQDREETSSTSEEREPNPYAPPQSGYCSFCRQEKEGAIQLRSAISAATICTECVAFCSQIIDLEIERRKTAAK